MTLVSGKHRKKESELAGKMTYLDLNVLPEYFEEYVAGCHYAKKSPLISINLKD